MDGNGRWAKSRNLPRVEGHRAGIASVREIVETAARLELRRHHPLRLLGRELEAAALRSGDADDAAQGVPAQRAGHADGEQHPLPAIGRIDGLDPSRAARAALRRERDREEQRPAVSDRAQLRRPRRDRRHRQSHHGRAARARDERLRRSTKQFFADHLYTADIDDPDLLIRTSGELRVSNFLLWQIAYAEIHVTKVLWPDFRRRDLFEAIIDFQSRERRYGGVDESDAQMFIEADESAIVGGQPGTAGVSPAVLGRIVRRRAGETPALPQI